MSRALYDMAELQKLKEINVAAAQKNFAGTQEFFDELDKFVNASRSYFNSYNPVYIIYDNTTRKDFLDDVNRLKKTLSLLKITSLSEALADLEYAVDTADADSLSDLILTFCVKAENTGKAIASSRIVTKPLILAVDDKPEILTAIVNMLKDDFMVMGVTSAAAALRALNKHTPELFLLDIEMPQVNGYQLAKSIRALGKFAQVPIIFLTGKNSRDDVITAMRNGGNDYIVKPVDKVVLREKILRLIDN